MERELYQLLRETKGFLIDLHSHEAHAAHNAIVRYENDVKERAQARSAAQDDPDPVVVYDFDRPDDRDPVKLIMFRQRDANLTKMAEIIEEGEYPFNGYMAGHIIRGLSDLVTDSGTTFEAVTSITAHRDSGTVEIVVSDSETDQSTIITIEMDLERNRRTADAKTYRRLYEKLNALIPPEPESGMNPAIVSRAAEAVRDTRRIINHRRVEKGARACCKSHGVTDEDHCCGGHA